MTLTIPTLETERLIGVAGMIVRFIPSNVQNVHIRRPR